MGGWTVPGGGEPRRIVVNTGEKGLAWRRLRVTGTPGHGSMPYGADNALIKAASVVGRLAAYRPAARITDVWKAYVEAMTVPAELKAALTDPARIDQAISQMPAPLARTTHACTHTTFSPNVAHGGQKTNTIPDVVDIDVDVRTLPGTDQAMVDTMLHEALGDLAGDVQITHLQESEATNSPRGNPLWEAIGSAAQAAYPGAELVPGMIVGGTDARFYRQRGAVAYGAGLFSPQITLESFASRFHGNDERVDVESLGLSADFWLHIAGKICG
jgi:acetylornithine deacetylase/succinyl-diaminopimelate desuccinylase-like protein